MIEVEGRVLILSSEDMRCYTSSPKLTDIKMKSYAELAHFDIVMLVEKDRTVIMKNRYGCTQSDCSASKVYENWREDLINK